MWAELHCFAVDLWRLIGRNDRRDLPEVEALVKHPVDQLKTEGERFNSRHGHGTKELKLLDWRDERGARWRCQKPRT